MGPKRTKLYCRRGDHQSPLVPCLVLWTPCCVRVQLDHSEVRQLLRQRPLEARCSAASSLSLSYPSYRAHTARDPSPLLRCRGWIRVLSFEHAKLRSFVANNSSFHGFQTGVTLSKSYRTCNSRIEVTQLPDYLLHSSTDAPAFHARQASRSWPGSSVACLSCSQISFPSFTRPAALPL